MAIPDRFPVRARSRELTWLTGRYTGAGTSVPAEVAGTGRGITVTRTGVGALRVTLDDKWPFVQAESIRVDSATARFVKVTPFDATNNRWVVQVATSADAAVDLTSSDELVVIVGVSATGYSP
jgi:hypothetical protein